MIDVPAAPAAGGDTTAATPPNPPPPTDTLPVGTPRARFALIAIDPGHGKGCPARMTQAAMQEFQQRRYAVAAMALEQADRLYGRLRCLRTVTEAVDQFFSEMDVVLNQ